MLNLNLNLNGPVFFFPPKNENCVTPNINKYAVLLHLLVFVVAKSLASEH